VLLLEGAATNQRWFVDGVRYVAEHVPDTRIQEVPGAGHSCMPAQPERLADELSRFFSRQHAGVAGS
jgi:pimeloyl-ACP methyl ester carboxylesterase